MSARPIQLRGTQWDWARPRVLGIVNVTPDSFSDGGRYAQVDAAIAHGLSLLSEGADALDVGGESTRPGATDVSLEQELERVIPVVQALASHGAVVSVDTRKAVVAQRALEAGACIVNDVGMGDPPEQMAEIVARAGGVYIAMHARGTPATMMRLTQYTHVVDDVLEWFSARVKVLHSAGLRPEQIVLDPGIGFAKDAAQSLELLSAIARVRGLGYAVCVGPSRKRFIASPESHRHGWIEREVPSDARVGGTAAAVACAVLAGCELIRVHDVFVMAQAARVAHAIRTAGGG